MREKRKYLGNDFQSSRVAGTKLDDEFYCMEKKSDLVVELVEDLQIKTKEYLQPNPTVRAKMAAVKGISKVGQHSNYENISLFEFQK